MVRHHFSALHQNDEERMDGAPTETVYSDPTVFSNTIGDVPSAFDPARQRLHSNDQNEKHAWHSQHTTFVDAPTELENVQFDTTRKKRQSTGDRLLFKRTSSWLSRHPVSTFRIPKFAAPWRHEQVVPPTGPGGVTTRRFDAKAQRRRIFVSGLVQWLLTAVLAALMISCLYGFSSLPLLTQTQKYLFNACITLLSLFIGLAVVAGFRTYASLMRWRFLAAKYRTIQDFELVMNCSSQSEVLRLLWAGRTPGRFVLFLNKTQLMCLLSLLLVIGLQVVIGMIGLTYSVDTAENFVELYTGNVTRAELSVIEYTDSDPYATLESQSGAANQFGGVGQVFTRNYGVKLGEESAGPENIYTFDNHTWAYQFVDNSANPAINLYADTNRYVTANASCAKLEITDHSGFVGNTTLYYNDEHGVPRAMYVEDVSTDTTTYMANMSFIPSMPRTAQIFMLNSGNGITTHPEINATAGNLIPSVLLTCNVTVSKVFNADQCLNQTTCEMPDEQAAFWAGSIGMSGLGVSEAALYTSEMQYRNYPIGSLYSWSFDYGAGSDGFYVDPSSVESLVAQFAVSAIAAYDDTGPRITAIGDAPRPASQLNVQWHWAIPAICLVPGVQLLVLFCVCLWANGALVKDGSYLSTARLLRPIVEQLHSGGSVLTGDEIAEELGNFEVIYGVRAERSADGLAYSHDLRDEDPEYHLGIIAKREGYGQVVEEGWCPGRKFPIGKYD